MDGNEDHSLPAPSSPNSITRSLAVAFKAISQRSASADDTNNNETCPFRSFADTMEGLSFSSLLAKMLHRSEVSAVTPEIMLPELGPGPTLCNPRKRSMSLSESLKTGTSVSHASAESVHFVKEFIKGNIDRTLYSKLILNLYFVYTVLENELDTHGPTKFPTVHFPNELARVETLRDDVEFFLGEDYLDTLHATGGKPSSATQDYMDRLSFIAKEEPLLLLSHAYTRYLGDLSGGTVLARVARRALNLRSDSTEDGAEEDGLRFYHFARIPSAKVFKDGYRDALDALPGLDSDTIERLVAEANVAFVLNMRIFEELDVLACIKGAEVRPVEEAVVYYTNCVEMQKEKRRMKEELGIESFSLMNGVMPVEAGGRVEEVAEPKCPFAILGGPNPHAEHDHEDGAEPSATAKIDHELVGAVQESGGRCPWPFVFFHDPVMGMQDFQTWIVIAMISCCIWNFQPGITSEM